MPEKDRKTSLKKQNWLIFLMVAIGIFMATLDGSIVNIALPSIMAPGQAHGLQSWIMPLFPWFLFLRHSTFGSLAYRGPFFSGTWCSNDHGLHSGIDR